MFSNYKRINSNKYNKQNWIWEKKKKDHWYRLERLGILRRGYWSRLRGTGWETGSFGPSQPVPKAYFLVVMAPLLSRTGVPGWETGTTGVSQPGQINVFVVVMYG